MERTRHRRTQSGASGTEGIKPIPKQKSVSRLFSDSLAHVDGKNRDDMFMINSGQSSSVRGAGTPMKKLLAEEMSKELDSKKRTPGIIARLMGLEAMPSPRLVHKQPPKGFPENHQRKNVSISPLRNSQLYEHQEYKDVYEDMEASYVTNRRHTALSKPSNASKSEIHDLQLGPQNRNTSRKSSKIQSEENLEKQILPTRIVILKPNLKKVKNTSASAMSPELRKFHRIKNKYSSHGMGEKSSEFTRRIRHVWDGTIDSRSSKVRGYAGDESSYDAYASDSDTDLEAYFELPSRKSFDDNNMYIYKHPSCSSGEAFVNRDRKKRDSEMRPKHLNAKKSLDMGMDGLKGNIGTSSRSRSVPASIGGKYQRRSMSRGPVKEKLSRKEENISKESKSSRKKQKPVFDERDSLLQANVKIQMEAKVSKPSELLSKRTSSVAENDDCKSFDQENSILQGPPEQVSPSGNSPVSSESSKEADDQPSPVSVLEIPFKEHTTSNLESFERVSAELNELRMQLQLLKLESSEYVEEEVPKQSPMAFERKYTLEAEDNWKSSYVLDVLIESGFEYSGLDIFKTTWKSPECPLDPGLFEYLEMKYGGDKTVFKRERKFLFDRINSGLLEIFKKRVDLCPWVMPKKAKFGLKWWGESVRDDIEKLLRQEFTRGEVFERVVMDMEWLDDSREEIKVIGNEIEKNLIDDMIAEVVCD